MPDSDSPLKRPIGLSGVITFVIAVAAAITVGSAWFDGRYALAGVAAVFFVGAMLIGLRTSR